MNIDSNRQNRTGKPPAYFSIDQMTVIMMSRVARSSIRELNQKTMKKLITVLIVISFGQMLVFAQRVSPFQVGAYQPGLVNLRDFASLPAGLFILNYNYWGNSKGYYNKDGKKLNGLDVDLSFLDPDLGTVNLNFDSGINGYINVPVFFYVSKFTLLGGARYMASISPTYLTADYRLYINLIADDFKLQGNASGFGDLSFMPLALSWSFEKKWDVGIWYSLYAPTGRYDTESDNNIGQGFWTHQIQTPVYFYAMDQATAIGIIPTLELNGKVKDADLRAGNRFTIEYGISQYFTDWLEVELMNSHNWQISDPSGGEFWWINTVFDSRDHKNAFSVGVGVWPWAGILNIRLKYIRDYGTRQRFQNEYWGLSFVLVPGILDEKT